MTAPATWYEYRSDSEHFDSFLLQESHLHLRLESLTGEPQGSSWIPPEIEVYRVGQAGDFPHLASHVPVFSRTAAEALQDLISSEIELLDLSVDGAVGDYFAVNVLGLRDCLDPETSDVTRSSSGKIMFIDHYGLRRSELEGLSICKISEAPLFSVLIDRRFVDRVAERGLRGLRLKPI